MDILFRYANEPTEATMSALSGAREVYGIRQLRFDREAHTVRLEYDATRLNAAVVTSLLRRSGLEIVEELPLIPPPAPEPVVEATEATKA